MYIRLLDPFFFHFILQCELCTQHRTIKCEVRLCVGACPAALSHHPSTPLTDEGFSGERSPGRGGRLWQEGR